MLYYYVIKQKREASPMPFETIATPNAPAAIGPYSQAIVYQGVVYASGQIPLDPVSGETVPGGIAEQARQSIENLSAVLEAAGSSLASVLKTTCYLTDMADFAVFNRVYAELFPGKPARACVAVQALPKGVLCEVEAIAAVNP
jgi:2-iminobutanoate/2-iminopropanoate deaminase